MSPLGIYPLVPSVPQFVVIIVTICVIVLAAVPLFLPIFHIRSLREHLLSFILSFTLHKWTNRTVYWGTTGYWDSGHPTSHSPYPPPPGPDESPHGTRQRYTLYLDESHTTPSLQRIVMVDLGPALLPNAQGIQREEELLLDSGPPPELVDVGDRRSRDPNIMV